MTQAVVYLTATTVLCLRNPSKAWTLLYYVKILTIFSGILPLSSIVYLSSSSSQSLAGCVGRDIHVKLSRPTLFTGQKDLRSCLHDFDLNTEGVVRRNELLLALCSVTQIVPDQSGRRDLDQALAARNWVITGHVLTVFLCL